MTKLENFLKSYGRYIVKEARKILQKKDKNTTGNLSKSLRYKLVKDTDGFSIQFIANKYGKFVSKGVRGTKVTRTYIDKFGKRKRSPFRFKPGVGNAPNIGAIETWINKRGIKGRDKLGRFIKSKSLAYLFSKSIQRKGIPAASYYTKPLSMTYKNFKQELLENFKEDIIKEIKTV